MVQHPDLVLRPRTLVASLFASALEGDVPAEESLRYLAPDDPIACAALEAIVVVDMEARFRADPDGHHIPQPPQYELDDLQATVAAVVREVRGEGT